jgi:hypothetical protein
MSNENTGKTPFPKTGSASEDLTAEDKKGLRKFIKSFKTMQAAADAIPMNRVTLLGIYRVGSGSPETIAAIREAIKPVTA